MIIVSACLMGENCKYNGENNYCSWVDQLKEKYTISKVCPELMGKLSVPRDSAEIVDEKVITKSGKDVTAAYESGAKIAYTTSLMSALKLGEEIEFAVLKSNSPSCGCGKIYDGSFSGKLIEGNGIFADMLRKKGIRVFTEDEKEKINEEL